MNELDNAWAVLSQNGDLYVKITESDVEGTTGMVLHFNKAESIELYRILHQWMNSDDVSEDVPAFEPTDWEVVEDTLDA